MKENEDLFQEGKNFIEEGKFLESLKIFEQLIKKEPNNSEFWNFKGVTLRGLGRYLEANECFNKSLQIDPRDKKAS